MVIKLTSRQYRAIVVAVVVAAVSLVVGLKYFSRAFPEASIRFRVSRSGSERIAQQFLARRGVKIKGYRHAAIFAYDDTAKLYLERTQGLSRLDQLTRGPLHLWRWSHRWFKSQQQEEFRVDVTPEGQIVGFEHQVPESLPAANLGQGAALGIAETFLAKVMGRNLKSLEFIGAEKHKRPARTDYAFTWREKGVNLGPGSLRVGVAVDGSQVAGYREFVKIPDAWLRSYQKLRSHNNAAQEVDQVFWALLCIAMLVILVRRLRDRDVRLKLALGLGATAAVLEFLSQINTVSLGKFSYHTTASFSSFITGYFFEALFGAIGIGVIIFLVAAAAEPVYREAFPHLIAFRSYFTWRGLRSRSFFMANVVGIALAIFFFAYQTVFYLAANRLGAWAPSDVPFSNILNTRIPWVAVLFTGFFPAVFEEMQFRAFAIPFLRKLTGSWPLALALAAFNWGFLHSAYPNQPFFIRGVEVGVGGIIVGVIMLRFGILATLMWHYSVDALYAAFLLLRSPNHYLVVSGALSAGIMLIPLIVAVTAYLASGTFTEEAALSNASEGVRRLPETAPETRSAAAFSYQPLSRRRLIAAAAIVIVFAGLAFIKVYHLGEGIRVSVTRAQATQAARKFLASRHLDPAIYHSATWLIENVDPLAVKYLAERLPLRRADRIIREASQPLLWKVRFFRPLHQEEQLVFVKATDGKVFGHRTLLSETAPGASLSRAQALALGRRAVEEHGYRLADFVLQDSEATKRKAREDYTLVWQARPGDPRNVGDAHYRLRVDIAGDHVVAFSRSFKLPEKWMREQESTGLANSALLACIIVLAAGLIAGAVWLIVKRARSGAIRWKASLKVAVALTVLIALAALNEFPVFGRAYRTSISLSNFHLQLIVSFVFLLLAGGVFIWFLIGLVTSLYPAAWKLFELSSRRVWRRDAAIAAVLTLVLGASLEKPLGLFASRFHAYIPPAFGGPPQSFDALSPALAGLLGGIIYSAVGVAVLAIAIYGVMRGWQRRAWWFWAGVILFLIALGPFKAHSVAEYGAGWVVRFVPCLAAVVVLALFFRDNPLAYVAAAFCSVVAKPLVDFFSQPSAFYRWDGVLLAVLAALVLIWLFAVPTTRRA